MWSNQQAPTSTTPASTPAASEEPKCLNCGASLVGPYCHQCGQEVKNRTHSVLGLILVWLDNTFMFDPLLLKSMWLMVRRPGQLTKEFINGRIVSQAHPLKLNMFLLALFVALFLFFTDTERLSNAAHDVTSSEKVINLMQMEYLAEDSVWVARARTSPRDTVQLIAPLSLADRYPTLFANELTIDNTNNEGLDRWLAVVPHTMIEDEVIMPVEEGIYHINPEAPYDTEAINLTNSVWQKMLQFTSDYFPLLVLLSAPLLALTLRLFRRKKREPMLHHFVFSWHYTALLELLIIIIYIAHLCFEPSTELLKWFLIISSCSYLSVAFRRVYDIGSWFKAIVNSLLISAIYYFICMTALIVIFIVACFSIANTQ